MRQVLSRLRPAENIGAGTLGHPNNSVEIPIENAQAGDFISVIGAGQSHLYNHIFLITCTSCSMQGVGLCYAHSYAKPEEGKYGHGVRIGTISPTDESSLVNAEWHEGPHNMKGIYLFPMLKEATSVTLRRLKVFNK
jgi:hypothetical protein